MISSLLERVFTLLTSEAGSLTYHLILAFSIVGSLQLSIGYDHQSKPAQFWRTFGGLCSLLVLQLGLFVSSGLAWQGVIEGNLWIPALDRAVTLVSLIIIIWLWAFPDPSPSIDTGALLLGLFALAAAIFSILWWSSQGIGIDFNGSKLDVANQVSCLCLAILGCLILLIQRPDGWGFGLGMLLLMSFGHAFQLFFFQRGEDYPGALRLGLMAAYPFLLLLPQRLHLSAIYKDRMMTEYATLAIRAKDQVLPGHALQLDSQIWKSLYTLVTENQPEKIGKAIVVVLAKAMQADLCLLLMPPDENGRITIQCGYDLKNSRYLDKVILYSRSLPMLAASLRMGRARQMTSRSTSPDMVNLARAFDLEQTGNLLSVPVLSSSGKAISSVVLLSPYSDRSWSQEDQSTLGDLARLMVHFLQHSHEVVDLKDELEQVRQMTRTTQDQLQLALEESQKIHNQFAVLQENAQRDQAQFANIGATLSAYDEARKTIEQLQAENRELRDATRLAAEGMDLQGRTTGGELRLALEEIAFLSSALSDADKKIQAFKSLQGGPIHVDLTEFDVCEVITQAVQDNDLKLKEKQISLELKLPDQSLKIVSDQKTLRKVMVILLQNAVSVTLHDGDITIGAQLQSSRNQPDYVLIQVTDTGGGIDAQDLPRVFSPRSTATQIPGLGDNGVDLPSVKILVEMLGGRAWVDSKPGQGSVFSILLPVASEIAVDRDSSGEE